MKGQNKLNVIDGETLMDMRLAPTKFCIDTLLPQGICILGGAPKIGKSWLVLDLCVRIAKGETVWNLKTNKGTVLYLCLEDTLRRIQERLNSITDDVPTEAYFTTTAHTLADGLCDDIRSFVNEHPDTVFIAVDTFQVIRGHASDTSYGNDYEDLRKLKTLADELNITLLLVHHLRKQSDSDPLNKISGTTGISGAVDAIFVLDKSKRSENNATLVATGRDIEYRELEIKFNKSEHVWELVSDSVEDKRMLLPAQMDKLMSYIQSITSFSGSNTEFAKMYCSFSGEQLSAKALKQMMNKWRYALEEHGVYFLNHRSNGERILEIKFVSQSSDASDGSDAENGSVKTCVPCDPCVPDIPSL